MDKDFIEAMLSLTYDAPCKFFCEKDDSLYFIIESRSSRALSKVENEVICDNFIETQLDGQIKNCYDFALKLDNYIIVEVKKTVHGKDVRDKIVVYNNEMEIVSEFTESDNKQYCLKLFNDSVRCVKEVVSNTYYNLDGSILQE